MEYFQYTASIAASLEGSISTSRLSTYRQLVGNDSLADALDLYAHNARLSGAFMLSTQVVEVTLRNACHRVLSRQFGSDWLTRGNVNLVAWQQREIEIAMNPGGFVPIDALHFGFWCQLFSRPNYLLWRAALYEAFADRPSAFTRERVFDTLNRIRQFRNRIAHHEQIIGHEPMARHADILEVVRWLGKDQSAWLEHYDQVPEAWMDIQAEKIQKRWTGF